MPALSHVELLLVALALAVGLLPVLRLARNTASRALSVLALAAWLFFSVVVVLAANSYRDSPRLERQIENRPIAVAESGYVTSKTCKSCHPREYATWHRSYHRTMTQVVTPQTTDADFDDVELELDGRIYRLSTTEDAVWVELDDPDHQGPGPAPRVKRQIVLSTGSHHDHNFWMEGGGDDRSLRILPFDYSLREGRWIPYRSSFIRPPQDPGRVNLGAWNNNCARCHTTRAIPRLERVGGKLQADTSVTEFGIACESCHGPAEAHVQHYRNPLERFRQHLSNADDATIVNPAKLGAKRSSQVCGACHGISFPRESSKAAWVQGRDSGEYVPGDDIHESRIFVQYRYTSPDYPADDEEKHAFVLDLARNRQEWFSHRYWPDGMVRVSGRDFSAMMESPCYERGQLECISCHTLHKSDDDSRSLDDWANDMLAPERTGNGACTQCHPQFSSQASLTAHTRHPPDSAGSSCYNCHMPFTVYGIQKAIRSHHIDSPSVAASVENGRPNACNQCHLDQTLQWTAQWLDEWYGIPAPGLTDEQRRVAASVLWALAGDAGQRALMAWSMSWEPALMASGEEWMRPLLARLLEDPYDAVRFMAIQSLRQHDGFEDFEYDFVEPPEEQIETRFRARNIWSAAPALPARGDPRAVLRSEEGHFDLSALRQLLEGRDDRPIYLLE